jgi:hypothetical protein
MDLDVDGWASDSGQVQVTSPSITGWAINDPDENLMPLAVPVLSVIFEKMLEKSRQEDDRSMVVHVGAFLWVLEKLFSEDQILHTWLGIDVRQVPYASLNDLWLESTQESGNDLNRVLVSYSTLMHFLSETYGAEVVPSLLAHISEADDPDEWLLLSVGHPLAVVEPGWEAWLKLQNDRD